MIEGSEEVVVNTSVIVDELEAAIVIEDVEEPVEPVEQKEVL